MDLTQGTRPAKVTIAVTILYVALGISYLSAFIQLLLTPTSLPRNSLLGNFFVVLICSLPINLFFYYKIGKGRNWARITFLVFFIVGSILDAPNLFQSLLPISFTGLINFMLWIIESIAIVMLFQKPSSDWFKLMKGVK